MNGNFFQNEKAKFCNQLHVQRLVYIRAVSYTVDTCGKLPRTFAVLSPMQFALVQLSPFYHLSNLDVTHVRKHTRPFAFICATESGVWAWERS